VKLSRLRTIDGLRFIAACVQRWEHGGHVGKFVSRTLVMLLLLFGWRLAKGF